MDKGLGLGVESLFGLTNQSVCVCFIMILFSSNFSLAIIFINLVLHRSKRENYVRYLGLFQNVKRPKIMPETDQGCHN